MTMYSTSVSESHHNTIIRQYSLFIEMIQLNCHKFTTMRCYKIPYTNDIAISWLQFIKKKLAKLLLVRYGNYVTTISLEHL